MECQMCNLFVYLVISYLCGFNLLCMHSDHHSADIQFWKEMTGQRKKYFQNLKL